MPSRDPYGDNRPFHFARFVRADGRISPWCYTTPRAMPLRYRWTRDRSAVTCKRCLIASAGEAPK